MGGGLENVKVVKIVRNNQKLVRYIDKNTNKVIQENVFKDRNGDGKFTDDELYSTAGYGYMDNYMFKMEYSDQNNNRFPDRLSRTMYERGDDGIYNLRKMHSNSFKGGFSDSPGIGIDYEHRNTQSMTDWSDMIRDGYVQWDINRIKDDIKHGLSSWDSWVRNGD